MVQRELMPNVSQMLVIMRVWIPGRVFCSLELGIGKCHAWDSRVPGNGVYCSIISAVAL